MTIVEDALDAMAQNDRFLGTNSRSDWRTAPGFFTPTGSRYSTVQALLKDFLRDKRSPSLLPERPIEALTWGSGAPLEKVIRGPDDAAALRSRPSLLRNAISIVEPWPHVGINALGEPVQASRNVALLAQVIADADSVLHPIWATGVSAREWVEQASAGLAIVVEGGAPSVYDEGSFRAAACDAADTYALIEEILLSRAPTAAPAIFICLGHQLAAHCLIRLLHRAVDQVRALDRLPGDSGVVLSTLREAASRIETVGEAIVIKKRSGEVVAEGWRAPRFAVSRNEKAEIGTRRLRPYLIPHANSVDLPHEVVDTYASLADEYDGVIDTMIEYELELDISMFHSDEVNERAVIFASWALTMLHRIVRVHRHVFAVGPLSWMLQLPCALGIQSSSSQYGAPVTQVSTICIHYQDYESNSLRRSFTCQFHPELLSDLRAFGERPLPSYAELKRDDGIRLFARLLYAGLQE